MSSTQQPVDVEIVEDTVAIEQYLKRPIRIDQTTWNTGDFLRKTIDPWSLYMADPAIRRKIDNYAFFRGTMKVKITVNGNAFYYGRGLVSYNPYGFDNREVERAPGNAPTVDNVRFSQRPHIIINPTESSGGELTLPFVFPLSMCQRTSTSNRDWSQSSLGRLIYSSFNPLRHSNGITSDITITTFAWFEDITLAGPILIPLPSTDPLYSDAGDEYGQGIVSRPASALARAAGSLTSIPMLKPYAMATQIGADAVGKVASLFGYSRPVNLNPINKFAPSYLGNIANTAVEDATDKLTYDPKQELSLDPSLLGVNTMQDELTVNNIASHESYFTRFEWKTDDAVDQLLFSTRVTPVMFSRSSLTQGTDTEYHLTPLALAALPFEFWRGSLIYRFQLAVSNFHKGRLRLVYDPVGSSSLGGTAPDFSTVYTRILDVTESKEFELRVGYNQPVAFREVDKDIAETADLPFSPLADITDFTATPVTSKIHNDNGVLSIYVLNELTTPNTADVNSPQVNVFVRAGPDFEVAGPSGFALDNFTTFEPPEELPQMFSDASELVPIKKSLDPIGKLMTDEHVNLNYFGEVFMSFRDMLKRYELSTLYLNPPVPENSEVLQWIVTSPNFPMYRGPDPNGPDSKGSAPWTVSKNTLMNWLTPAFVCRRGGIRWKFNLESYSTDRPMTEMYVYRRSGNPILQNTITDLQITGIDPKIRAVGYHSSMFPGGALTNVAVKPTLEVEFPYYANRKFNAASETTEIGLYGQKHSIVVFGRNPSATPSEDIGAYIKAYCAAGEDFNLSWFINAPVLYLNPDFP